MRQLPLDPKQIAEEMVEFHRATTTPHPIYGGERAEWYEVVTLITQAILRERWRYRFTKWIPLPRKEVTQYVHDGQRNALDFYYQAIEEDHANPDIREYDFRRGFEYGTAWVLDHPELTEELQEAREKLEIWPPHQKEG